MTNEFNDVVLGKSSSSSNNISAEGKDGHLQYDIACSDNWVGVDQYRPFLSILADLALDLDPRIVDHFADKQDLRNFMPRLEHRSQ